MTDSDQQLISLNKGLFAIVDREDYESISKYHWYVTADGYAKHTFRSPDKPDKSILMHRYIMKTPQDLLTDHINGDKLDNRKSNLRFATPLQNAANRKMVTSNTSGYVGVDKRPYGKWRASIKINKKSFHIGNFDSPDIAHAAYLEKAKEIHGEFVRL